MKLKFRGWLIYNLEGVIFGYMGTLAHCNYYNEGCQTDLQPTYITPNAETWMIWSLSSKFILVLYLTSLKPTLPCDKL